MDKLEEEGSKFVQGHQVAFCTMGVGQPFKASRDELFKVDVQYLTSFAKICKAGGTKHISLLGSCMANTNSSMYYLSVKGKAEDALKAQNFERVSLYRPGLLVTPSARYGATDSVLHFIFPKISWMLPDGLHDIKVEDLAKAMRVNAELRGKTGVEVLHHKDFKALINPLDVNRKPFNVFEDDH